MCTWLRVSKRGTALAVCGWIHVAHSSRYCICALLLYRWKCGAITVMQIRYTVECLRVSGAFHVGCVGTALRGRLCSRHGCHRPAHQHASHADEDLDVLMRAERAASPTSIARALSRVSSDTWSDRNAERDTVQSASRSTTCSTWSNDWVFRTACCQHVTSMPRTAHLQMSTAHGITYVCPEVHTSRQLCCL